MIGPGGLIALLASGGAGRPNLAVTRERLGGPPQAPHALAAALPRVLRRRRLWLEARGGRILGLASARPLAGPGVWQIDALTDAAGDGEAVAALLERAQAGALRAGAGRLLLRTPARAPGAIEGARAAGFRPLLAERLWRAAPPDAAPACAAPRAAVREAGAADWHDRFLLAQAALPAPARRTLGPTRAEWRAAQEEQWLDRRARDLVADADGRAGGVLRQGRCRGGALVELLAADGGAAGALLRAARARLAPGEPLLAIAPRDGGAAERALADARFEPIGEYALLGRRLERPAAETAPAPAGAAAPAGGWR